MSRVMHIKPTASIPYLCKLCLRTLCGFAIGVNGNQSACFCHNGQHVIDSPSIDSSQIIWNYLHYCIYELKLKVSSKEWITEFLHALLGRFHPNIWLESLYIKVPRSLVFLQFQLIKPKPNVIFSRRTTKSLLSDYLHSGEKQPFIHTAHHLKDLFDQQTASP